MLRLSIFPPLLPHPDRPKVVVNKIHLRLYHYACQIATISAYYYYIKNQTCLSYRATF